MTNAPISRRRTLQSIAAFGLIAGCDAPPAAPRSAAVARSGGSVVSYWTNAILQAVRAGSVPPPAATRAFAAAQTAGFVAANGTNPRYATPFAVGSGPQGADADAAYAAAFARAATIIMGRDFTPALSRYFAQTGGGDTRAVQWGDQVGRSIAGSRQSDGSATATTLDTFRYPKQMDAMGWEPTSDGRQALLPGWGKVRPWIIGEARQFLPRPFPATNSAEFARQYNKVKALGGANSTIRTADQTQAAFFWEDGPGGVTPPATGS